MYLASRVRAADPGRIFEALQWSAETRDYVNAHSGLTVSAHTAVFGRPIGTMTWAAIVENRAQWLAETQAMLNDANYQQLVRRGAELFSGPPEDSLRQIMHMSGMTVDAPRPPLTQTWSAVIQRFQFDAAMAFGVEVSDYVNKLTGAGLVLLAENYGDFGTLVWIAGLESPEQADSMNEQMLADEGWRTMVANVADLFIDGRTKVWLNRTLP
jgi:hypothetical protein